MGEAMSLDAMKQALEALEEIADEVFSPYDNKLGDAILALRAVIEQAQEPVAWVWWGDNGDGTESKHVHIGQEFSTYWKPVRPPTPLYTAPRHCKPPRFPTMLRKMWSGSEVQKWIDENWEKTHE